MQRTSRPTISFVAPYISGFYYGAILAGIQQTARRHGIRLLISQWPTGGTHPVQFARDLIDGWIIGHKTEGGEQIVSTGIPVVSISHPLPGVPLILPNNRSGMGAAVAHLIEHGHRQIAFIGCRENIDIHERLDGYLAALAEAGIPRDPQLEIDVDSYLELGGQEGARLLIERGVPCTAVAAGTDQMALGAIKVLRAAGYRFPEDLAIVGFDNLALIQSSDLPLTTVRQRFDTIGTRAVEVLLDMLAGKPAPRDPVYVDTVLITRRSCGCTTQMVRMVDIDLAEISADDWRERLAKRLVGLLLYPDPLDPARPALSIWPGLGDLIDSLDLVARGGEPPMVQFFERIWAEALEISIDLIALNNAFALIESAGWRRRAALPHSEATRQRMATLINALREALLRVTLTAETRNSQYIDGILMANADIGSRLLGSGTNHAPDLSWLRYTAAEWGYLGLWSDGDMSTLMVTSSYSRAGQHPNLNAHEFATTAFPPQDVIFETAPEDAAHTMVLVPVRSTKREWGMLVLGGPFQAQITVNANPTGIWAEMLATELDRAQLLAEISQQQATLQIAYDRERALANTVRELGCPIIPLMPGVLLIPLIGAIDSDRASLIIQAVLEEVGRWRATEVLIDVMGVPVVDAQVANALIQMARMNSLLGARSTLVGVRPEIAESIVSLGVSLADIHTSATLAAALQALQRRM